MNKQEAEHIWQVYGEMSLEEVVAEGLRTKAEIVERVLEAGAVLGHLVKHLTAPSAYPKTWKQEAENEPPVALVVQARRIIVCPEGVLSASSNSGEEVTMETRTRTAYRWTKVWAVQTDNDDPTVVGDTITVVASDGESKQVVTSVTQLHTAKGRPYKVMLTTSAE